MVFDIKTNEGIVVNRNRSKFIPLIEPLYRLSLKELKGNVFLQGRYAGDGTSCPALLDGSAQGFSCPEFCPLGLYFLFLISRMHVTRLQRTPTKHCSLCGGGRREDCSVLDALGARMPARQTMARRHDSRPRLHTGSSGAVAGHISFTRRCSSRGPLCRSFRTSSR